MYSHVQNCRGWGEGMVFSTFLSPPISLYYDPCLISAKVPTLFLLLRPPPFVPMTSLSLVGIVQYSLPHVCL